MNSPQFTQNDITFLQSSWIALMNRHNDQGSLAAAVALAFYQDSGRNVTPGDILSLFAVVPSGGPTSTTPHPAHQPPVSFGHFNPADLYRPASPLIDPTLLHPSPLQHQHQVASTAALAPAQVQYPPPLLPMASRESSIAPVKIASRKGKGKETTISVDAVETQPTPVSLSRRKNAFLAIAKQAKILWQNRAKHTRVISLAIVQSSVSDGVKAAAIKAYDETKFEDLTPHDQGLWDQLAKHVAQVESTYAQISSVERNSLVHSEFSYLHHSTLNAFGIVPLTINFVPPHGVMPAQAEFLITPPQSQRLAYLHWLAAEHPALYKSFRDSTQAYALYLFGASKPETEVLDLSDGEENTESDSDSSVVEIQNPAPRHADMRNGIRIFEGLMEKKPFVSEARKHYSVLIADRFKAAGYKHKSVDWAGIARNYETWVDVSAVPTVEDTTGPVPQIRPAKLIQSNQLNRLDLVAWLAFFDKAQDPQCAQVTWEKGLLFRPSALVNAQQVFGDDDTNTDDEPASASTPIPSTNTAAANDPATTQDIPVANPVATDAPATNTAADPATTGEIAVATPAATDTTATIPAATDTPTDTATNAATDPAPEPSPNDVTAPGTESTPTTGSDANPTTLPAPAANNSAPTPATTPDPKPNAAHDPASDEPAEDAASDKLSDAPEPEVKKKRGRNAKAKTIKPAKAAPSRASQRTKKRKADDLDVVEPNASAGKRRR